MKKATLLLVMSLFVVCSAMSAWADGSARMPNPGWSYMGQTIMGNVTVVQGTNPQVAGCQVQSKWHVIDRTGRPNPGAQVVITNPDATCAPGSARLQAALSRAASLQPQQCGANDCAVKNH